MKTIQIGADVDELWDLMNQQSDQSNRIICVYEDSALIGIITDSQIRKYISNTRRLPQSLSEVVRTNFIHVHATDSRLEIAESIESQLQARELKDSNAITDILLLQENEANLVPISEFATELSYLRDRHVVIGLGFVGLTLLAVLNTKCRTRRVFGVEKDHNKVSRIKNRDYYILEPGLISNLSDFGSDQVYRSVEDYFNGENISSGRNIYIVAVQTPLSSDGKSDLEPIFEAIKNIAKNISRGDVIIIRSTVPIGSCRKFANYIAIQSKLSIGIDFYFGFVPERTVEGDAIHEIESLPQIVAGYSEACTSKIQEVVKRWSTSILVATSLETAEMIKLSNNAYRDHHFAFSNELALIANTHNIDVHEVIALANLGYPRSNIARPSPGVGGPCLSKDSYLLLQDPDLPNKKFFAHNYSPNKGTILSARKINESIPRMLSQKILEDNPLSELQSCEGLVIGITFKGSPPTNDYRNSPSMEIIKYLLELEYKMFLWDAELEDSTIRNMGYHSIPRGDESKKIKPAFCYIGNNHSHNLLMVKELMATFPSIKKIYDPWDLIRISGESKYFSKLGITIRNMSVDV